MGVCRSMKCMIYLSIQRNWENSWSAELGAVYQRIPVVWTPTAVIHLLPIPSKHIVPVCCAQNSEAKFSSDGGTGGAQGTEESVPLSASPKNSGDKQEWGSSAPSLPYQTLSGLWKWKNLRNTEPRRLHLNLLGGLVPVLLPGSPASFYLAWGDTEQ